MEFQDFCKYFEVLFVSHYHEGFKYSAINFQTKDDGEAFFSFESFEKTLTYISVV